MTKQNPVKGRKRLRKLRPGERYDEFFLRANPWVERQAYSEGFGDYARAAVDDRDEYNDPLFCERLLARAGADDAA